MAGDFRIGGPAGTAARNPVQNKPGLYQRVLERPGYKPVIGFLEGKGLNKGNLIKNLGISESEIESLAEFPAKIDLILMAQESQGKLGINELCKRILHKELKLTKEGLVFEEKGITSKETVPAGKVSPYKDTDLQRGMVGVKNEADSPAKAVGMYSDTVGNTEFDQKEAHGLDEIGLGKIKK